MYRLRKLSKLKALNSSQKCKALFAGCLVGMGVVANTLSTNKYIGAMLFSTALLVIIKCNLELYTGRIGFFYENKYSIYQFLQMLYLNLIGVTTIFAMRFFEDYELPEKIAMEKFSHSSVYLLSMGILCGILMYIAIYCKNTVITIFCIMTFILSGYEHCIADFPYLLVAFSWINLFKYICIIIGNTIGAMVVHIYIAKEDY
ncbi:formate/nitrite transporter family protein [Acetivibrio ethanolgignens]|uniref:Formate/nitrite transporter n=1 Tax=Acetivibrio ethanolgignens TaxID=290052 RepID=A0A0V8QBE5_9FIRM|nr:formate/nitrite transporter family protein [Acetivibrio ethanolgignens]KSV57401.1 hypothetical protein ASU35_16355 [Acetivibrio ethanolgignens]